MTGVSNGALITFLDGFTIAEDVLELAWDSEIHGMEVTVLDENVLQVLPVARITRADAVAIRRHKAELLALCRYVDSKQGAADTSLAEQIVAK